MPITPKFPRSIVVMLREPELSVHQEFLRTRLRAALPEVSVQFVSAVEQLRDPSRVEVLVTPVREWVDDVVRVAPNLEWIHFLSAGVDGIWELRFEKSQYLLSKSSGVHAKPMAEYVVGGILYFLKGFHIFRRQQRATEWKRHWLDEAEGKGIVIVGLGAIGREIARRCKQMGMTVTGVATTVRDVEHVDTVVESSQLPSVLSTADFVTVCVPLTERTRGLLDRPMLTFLKSGAYLIDISRGTVVDQTALADLIRDGHIAGALLDVFENEPLPTDSPLWGLDNVLITPHVSGTTPYYMERAVEVFLQNLASLRSNGILTTPVDLRAMY